MSTQILPTALLPVQEESHPVKEPSIATDPCCSSSSSDSSSSSAAQMPPADTSSNDHKYHHQISSLSISTSTAAGVPSSISPIVTPTKPSASKRTEYGPSLSAVRRSQSQYNRSLIHSDASFANSNAVASSTSSAAPLLRADLPDQSSKATVTQSPSERIDLTSISFAVKPVKTLDIGYGALVVGKDETAMVSDDEGSIASEDDEFGNNDERTDDDDDSVVDDRGDVDSSTTSSEATEHSEDSNELPSSNLPLVVAPVQSKESDVPNDTSSNNDDDDDDAFLHLQTQRYESMQTLGELAVPGSSKLAALVSPCSADPPISEISISTSDATSTPPKVGAPRPTSGKGFFNFILSAATVSNEAAEADRAVQTLAICNGGVGDVDGQPMHDNIAGVSNEIIPIEEGDEENDDASDVPLSPASPDELMDVDDGDDESDGFSALGEDGHYAMSSSAAIVPHSPAADDERVDLDDASDSDEEDEESEVESDARPNPSKRNGPMWRDDSKKHPTPHQYHRTRGNIAFRTPKFFRDPLAGPSPSPAVAGAMVGGSALQLSAARSPLSDDDVSPMSSQPNSPTKKRRESYANKFTSSVVSERSLATAAKVSSDIFREGEGGSPRSSSPQSSNGVIASFDEDFEKSLDAKNKKAWRKGLRNPLTKLRMPRRGKKTNAPGKGKLQETVQSNIATSAVTTFVSTPMQQKRQISDTKYDTYYDSEIDDEEEGGLACPIDLEMPGIALTESESSSSSPKSTSTALVVVDTDELSAQFKAHQARPDLDKFRNPEDFKKMMTPFAMWYDHENELIQRGGAGGGDNSTANNDLALVPVEDSDSGSNNNKSKSAKMISAFLSRGSKCASATAVVYDTDDDSSDEEDNDDDSTGSRVGISRPTGCLYDAEEDAYGGGGDGLMEESTDHVLNHLMAGPLQGYMTGLSAETLENKNIKAIQRTVHKHTSEGAGSPMMRQSRSQFVASGRNTTTYSMASLNEKGVDLVGAGNTNMKVYRLEGTGESGSKKGSAATASSSIHKPSPADETHPPTREELAKSKAGTGATSLQESFGRSSIDRPQGRGPKASNSILMSSLAYSALLNEDTIYSDDDEENEDAVATSDENALVEYNGPMRISGSALAHLGRSSSRSLTVHTSSPTRRNKGPAAPRTRAVAVSGENSITVVNEGTTSDAPTIKVFVLLLQPRMRLFELAQLVYYPHVATIGDLIDLIPNNATEPLLGNQAYVGLCRPNNDGQSSMTDLEMMASGAAEQGSANIYRGEMLVAIPEGYSGEQCAKMAKPILANQEFSKLMARADPLAPNTELRQ